MTDRWSLAEKAGTFAQVITRTLLAGGRLARDETVTHRLAICGRCEYHVYGNKCRICGCNISAPSRRWLDDLRRKVMHPSSVCPLYKWIEEDSKMTDLEGRDLTPQERIDLQQRAADRWKNLERLKLRKLNIPKEIEAKQQELAQIDEIIAQAQREYDALPIRVEFVPSPSGE